VTLDVSLSTPATSTVTVDYATQNGTPPQGATAGSDYVAKSGTLTFAAGVSSQPVTITVNGDTTTEGDEHFGVNLSNAQGAPIVEGTSTVTILDDDPSTGLKVSVGDVKVLEGNGGSPTATVTVTLSAPSPGGVKINYATADGTATAGSDSVAKSGSIKFGAGKTFKSFTVPI
jgi:chitinase